MPLQHLRSSTAHKRPVPGNMSDGQLGINTNTGSPGLFFKDSNNTLVKVGPVHVGTTAPNASPASGGTAGNSVGEQWLDTTGGTYVFKVWDGSAWRSETGTFVDVNGDVMTGALGIIAGSASAPGLYCSGDTNTGLFSPGADQLALTTGGTGRLFIDANGNTGLGGANSLGYGTNGPTLQVIPVGTPSGAVTVKSGCGYGFGNVNTAIVGEDSTGGNYLAFRVNNSEHARITSTGRLGLGTSNAAGLFHSNTTNGNVSYFGGPIGVTNGNYTGIQIGYTELNGAYAKSMIVQEQKGDGNARGTIHILNNNTGDSSSATLADARLSITSAGLVGVGTTNPQTALDVRGEASIAYDATYGLRFYNQDRNNWSSIGNNIATGGTSANLVFKDSTGEVARMTGGRLLVGTSSGITGSLLCVNGISYLGGNAVSNSASFAAGAAVNVGTSASANTGAVAVETMAVSTATRHHLSFSNPNGVVGSISTNASATAYNTSSDYRLKENIEPIEDAAARVLQLNPCRFNFIVDPSRTVDGFIAHEAQAVVPEAITGVKDELDQDGNPIYQGIDQSKLVPLLTAALQDALGRISDLEARLAAAGI